MGLAEDQPWAGPVMWFAVIVQAESETSAGAE